MNSVVKSILNIIAIIIIISVLIQVGFLDESKIEEITESIIYLEKYTCEIEDDVFELFDESLYDKLDSKGKKVIDLLKEDKAVVKCDLWETYEQLNILNDKSIDAVTASCFSHCVAKKIP